MTAGDMKQPPERSSAGRPQQAAAQPSAPPASGGLEAQPTRRQPDTTGLKLPPRPSEMPPESPGVSTRTPICICIYRHIYTPQRRHLARRASQHDRRFDLMLVPATTLSPPPCRHSHHHGAETMLPLSIYLAAALPLPVGTAAALQFRLKVPHTRDPCPLTHP